MNIFTIIFCYKILAKYSPKGTKLHYFKEILGKACHRAPIANAWLANAPIFPKIF